MPATGVTLGNIFLPAYDDYTSADSEGTIWELTGIDGWYDGWQGTGVVEQRSQADGDWVTPQWAGGRIVHITGNIEAGSWDGVSRAWDRLMAQLPFRQFGTLVVNAGEGTYHQQTAQVRQHEKPILADRFDNRATFSLSLYAPDPRRYGTTLRTSTLVLPNTTGGIKPPLTAPFTVTGTTTQSQVTLTNAGNTTTYPTLTLSGPCPPARLVNLTTSEALRVFDEVPAGQTLVIDLQNGIATNGGQSRRVLGAWWGLIPGENEISFVADGYEAGAELLVTYRHAWK